MRTILSTRFNVATCCHSVPGVGTCSGHLARELNENFWCYFDRLGLGIDIGHDAFPCHRLPASAPPQLLHAPQDAPVLPLGTYLRKSDVPRVRRCAACGILSDDRPPSRLPPCPFCAAIFFPRVFSIGAIITHTAGSTHASTQTSAGGECRGRASSTPIDHLEPPAGRRTGRAELQLFGVEKQRSPKSLR